MTLDADSIVDRRRLKRRLLVWRTIALLLVVGATVVLLQTWAGERALGPLGGGYVARVNVVGLITEDRETIEKIHDLADDPAVRAVIVYIDSPGGTVVGGEAFFVALRDVAERKPVAAVMGTTAASAGYMVASAADMIFARAGSITGSIGVIMQAAEFSSMLESLGISTEAIRSAPLKAVPSPLEPLSPEGREVAQTLVDEIYDMFVDMVRERRNLTEEEVIQVADGRVFTGRQAMASKLVDAIGGEDAARAWLDTERGVSQDLPARDVDPPRGPFGLPRIVAALFGKSLFSERLILDGLVAVWHPELGT